MELDKYNRRILREKDLIDLLYLNTQADLSNLYVTNPDTHNAAIDANYSELSKLSALSTLNLTVEKWHKQNQSNWYMPDECKNFDIAAWVLEQCKEIGRAHV